MGDAAGTPYFCHPLSTVTFATLTPEYRTQGTALYSLSRNIGSSIGISFVSFLLARNTQIAHADIAASVTPYNEAMKDPAVASIWNMATELGRMALNSEITRQATVIAYADDFKLMMIVALAALPLLLFLHKAEQPARGADPAID